MKLKRKFGIVLSSIGLTYIPNSGYCFCIYGSSYFPYLLEATQPYFKGIRFLGFLFTFGSAGSLSNIIAGLILTYMRLFKIGDRVKIGDVVGDVIENHYW
jgi:hypothetical protein